MTNDKKPPARTKMTRERWRQIEEVFDKVVDQDPEKRAGTMVGLDDTLRAEVEALLARADGKQDNAAKVVVRAARRMRNPTTELVGRRLGPYRLINELGRGGMGTVYLANREDQYRTEVAIKVLQRGLDSAPALARFRDERQILATLEHPSIVRLLDGGTSDDGTPYLVMERVQGVPITRFANDRKLSVEERLELFRKVCAAVQYAHTKAVIHRDLKPSNILVTADGVPKLLDFGIAKLAHSTGEFQREAETRTGMMMLTPEYASPEQVRAESVSTASDVYSLGAVLYELLTNAPAHKFEGGGIATLLEIIDRVPARPSVAAPIERRKQLVGDLDNIILKALDKEPHRRYASAEHFAEDLRRHLDGMPVEARAATWTYRAGKFVRRNRIGVGAAAFVTIALAAATVISIQQARRAEAERRVAERRFEDVRTLANTLLFQVDDRISNLAGATDARELIVSRALEYLDRLAREATDNSALTRELAVAYMKIGDVQGNPLGPNLGHAEDGLASYRKAEELIQRLASDGESTATLEVRVRVGSGMLHRNQDEVRAEKLLLEAVARAADLPPTPELQRSIVEASVGLAEQAANRQDAAAVRKHARKSLDAATTWSRLEPSAPLPKYFTGIARELTGQAAMMFGDPETAVSDLDLARATFRELMTQHPQDARYRRELGFVLHLLAGYRAGAGAGDLWQPNTGDLEGARAGMREAIALHRRAVETDPADTRGKLDLAAAFVILALASSLDDAVEPLDEARKIYDRLTVEERQDPYAINLEWVLECASAAPLAQAHRPTAAAVLERARKLSAASTYPMASLICSYQLLDAQRLLLGAPIAAAASMELADQLRKKLDATPDAIVLRIGLVEALRRQQDLTGSCAPARQAVAVWAKYPGAPTAYTRRHLGTLETNAHDCEKKRDHR